MNAAKNPIDDIETMILLALDANHENNGTFSGGASRGRNVGGDKFELRDQGELLRIDSMKPRSAFTFDISGDDDRLFSTSPDYLMAHPAEIIGEQAESILLHDGWLKWTGLRRLSKPPRGVVALGKVTHWYENHFRHIHTTGRGAYFKRVVPLDRNGRPLPAKINGHWICAPESDGVSLILTASIIEDAHRSGSMLATVSDATEIRFPVALDAYKELFALRDAPMVGNRRKAILHWVCRHIRASNRGKLHAVKQHTRGVDEFVIDGLRVRLEPNDGTKLANA